MQRIALNIVFLTMLPLSAASAQSDVVSVEQKRFAEQAEAEEIYKSLLKQEEASLKNKLNLWNQQKLHFSKFAEFYGVPEHVECNWDKASPTFDNKTCKIIWSQSFAEDARLEAAKALKTAPIVYRKSMTHSIVVHIAGIFHPSGELVTVSHVLEIST